MEEEYQDSGANEEAAAPEAERHEEVTQQESRQVPLSALEAERHERQRLQDEMRMIREHFALMESRNQAQASNQQQGPDDDDIVTYKDLKKFVQPLASQYDARLTEMQMMQRHPDYSEVVTKYLPEVLRGNPELKNSLEKTQDYQLAYYLAKNSPGYLKENSTRKRNADAERIVQNANRPGNLSAVGKSAPMSEARRWKDMSDEDFIKQVNKHMNG